MTQSVYPDPSTPFGERVAERLKTARVVWFTTVGKDGTPQPNPVWFLPVDEGILIFNRAGANRVTHIQSRPTVSLNFDGNGQGGDIVVLTGTARRLDDQPQCHEIPAYVDKYGDAMISISGSLEGFGAAYPVPILVEVAKVRGF